MGPIEEMRKCQMAVSLGGGGSMHAYYQHQDAPIVIRLPKRMLTRRYS